DYGVACATQSAARATAALLRRSPAGRRRAAPRVPPDQTPPTPRSAFSPFRPPSGCRCSRRELPPLGSAAIRRRRECRAGRLHHRTSARPEAIPVWTRRRACHRRTRFAERRPARSPERLACAALRLLHHGADAIRLERCFSRVAGVDERRFAVGDRHAGERPRDEETIPALEKAS